MRQWKLDFDWFASLYFYDIHATASIAKGIWHILESVDTVVDPRHWWESHKIVQEILLVLNGKPKSIEFYSYTLPLHTCLRVVLSLIAKGVNQRDYWSPLYSLALIY